MGRSSEKTRGAFLIYGAILALFERDGSMQPFGHNEVVNDTHDNPSTTNNLCSSVKWEKYRQSNKCT